MVKNVNLSHSNAFSLRRKAARMAVSVSFRFMTHFGNTDHVQIQETRSVQGQQNAKIGVNCTKSEQHEMNSSISSIDADYLKLAASWDIFCAKLDKVSSRDIILFDIRNTRFKEALAISAEILDICVKHRIGALDLEWSSIKRFMDLLQQASLCYPDKIPMEERFDDDFAKTISVIEFYNFNTFESPQPSGKALADKISLSKLWLPVPDKKYAHVEERFSSAQERRPIPPDYDVSRHGIYTEMMQQGGLLALDFTAQEQEQLWRNTVAVASLETVTLTGHQFDAIDGRLCLEQPLAAPYETSKIGYPKYEFINRCIDAWAWLNKSCEEAWPDLKGRISASTLIYKKVDSPFVRKLYTQFLVPACRSIYTLHKFRANQADLSLATVLWKLDVLAELRKLIRIIPHNSFLKPSTREILEEIFGYLIDNKLDADNHSVAILHPMPYWDQPATANWFEPLNVPAVPQSYQSPLLSTRDEEEQEDEDEEDEVVIHIDKLTEYPLSKPRKRGLCNYFPNCRQSDEACHWYHPPRGVCFAYLQIGRCEKLDQNACPNLLHWHIQSRSGPTPEEEELLRRALERREAARNADIMAKGQY